MGVSEKQENTIKAAIINVGLLMLDNTRCTAQTDAEMEQLVSEVERAAA